MIRNTASYKIGSNLVLSKDGYEFLAETKLLEKSRGMIKVRFLDDGWTKPSTEQWLDNYYWTIRSYY